MALVRMYMLWLSFLCVHILEGSGKDPCDKINHDTFVKSRMGSRNEKCNVDGTVTQLCDVFVKDNWYVIPNAKLLNHRPATGRCGVAYPAWMNGSFPQVEDGIVNRTICIRAHSDYCASNITIQIKNCKLYFVYYLKQMKECGQAYCIESQFPCKEPPTTTVSTGTQKNSTKYILIGIAVGVGILLCLTAVVAVVVIKSESCKRKRKVSCGNECFEKHQTAPPSYEDAYPVHA